MFFFVLCTLCWQFLWEGSYLRYLCLFTINVLCFCFVFLRLVYPMLAVSLVSLLFTLFVFVYYTHIVFLLRSSSSCVPNVGSFSGRALIYVICVCLQYTYCVFVLFSLSCVPYVSSFSGKALIYVICVCLLYTYCVFVLFFFVLCTLCWQFLWEGSYLRYLCLFTIHILCFCFVFLRLVYPMLAVSLGRLLFTLFVFVYYTHIVFLLGFFVLCTLCWQFLWEGSYLRYLCLFTIHILCFCFVFLCLVYPMLAVSLGRLLFTLFVFVYYTHIVFLFCFSSSCVPYVGSFSGRALIYVICVCLL